MQHLHHYSAHSVLAIFMIPIILLQPGKEGGRPPRAARAATRCVGPAARVTSWDDATIVATMFMFTSISLAWYSSDKVQGRLEHRGRHQACSRR